MTIRSSPENGVKPFRGRAVFNTASAWLFCVLICWVVLSIPARGQTLLPQQNVVRSHSGQFIVQTTPLLEPPRAILKLTANSGFIRLQPNLLTVSCERISKALDQQLELRSPWQGKVYLALYPAAKTNDTVYIASQRFKDGWQYEVRLPQVLERARYVAAITQVLLLEFANRGLPERSAEIPPWLSEGLAQNLLSTSELQIILPPPSETVNGLPLNSTFFDRRADDPLEQAHQALLRQQPLTFHELSWPLPEQLQGEQAVLFRSCAQLFFRELLALPDGRACLRSFLSTLPSRMNWQFAFLQAYHNSFQRPLDVEKWWALHAACFSGRELGQTWSVDESWRKLDEAIRAPVEIRAQTNDLPMRGETTLQAILRDWAPQDRTVALKAKLAQLEMVRLRLPQEMVHFVDDYRRVINQFLQSGSVSERGVLKAAIDQKSLTDALKALDALDWQRSQMLVREKTNKAESHSKVLAGRIPG